MLNVIHLGYDGDQAWKKSTR